MLRKETLWLLVKDRLNKFFIEAHLFEEQENRDLEVELVGLAE